MIGYVVRWTTVEGRARADVFLPLAGLGLGLPVHVCKNPKASADAFVQQIGTMFDDITERTFCSDLDVLTAV